METTTGGHFGFVEGEEEEEGRMVVVVVVVVGVMMTDGWYW